MAVKTQHLCHKELNIRSVCCSNTALKFDLPELIIAKLSFPQGANHSTSLGWHHRVKQQYLPSTPASDMAEMSQIHSTSMLCVCVCVLTLARLVCRFTPANTYSQNAHLTPTTASVFPSRRPQRSGKHWQRFNKAPHPPCSSTGCTFTINRKHLSR